MVCFFLSLLKRKLPQICPKRGGGSRPLLDNARKEAAYFSGLLPLVMQGIIQPFFSFCRKKMSLVQTVAVTTDLGPGGHENPFVVVTPGEGSDGTPGGSYCI